MHNTNINNSATVVPKLASNTVIFEEGEEGEEGEPVGVSLGSGVVSLGSGVVALVLVVIVDI